MVFYTYLNRTSRLAYLALMVPKYDVPRPVRYFTAICTSKDFGTLRTARMASSNTSPSLSASQGPRTGTLPLPKKPAPVPEFEEEPETDVPDPADDRFGDSQVDEMKPIRRSFHSWTDPNEEPEIFQPNHFTHDLYTGYLETFMREMKDNQQLFKAVVKQRRQDCGFQEPSRSSSLDRFWNRVGFTRWGLVWWWHGWHDPHSFCTFVPTAFSAAFSANPGWKVDGFAAEAWFFGNHIWHIPSICRWREGFFCTLHIFCTSFAHLLHAHLRTNAQCGFSTAHRIFHSIFRSKSSSVRDWLSAKRMAKTPPPFALQIYGFAISGQKMCFGEAQTP